MQDLIFHTASAGTDRSTVIYSNMICHLFAFKESVSSTFGCGVSSGCVVDVGHEKTSICCVEDGLTNPASRYTFEDSEDHQ